tara:strand:+ start:188 stop:460 length:273 start_codon:yes stop_codon:yes gene_type:complete
MDDRHCDDIADDTTQPQCLRDFINHARAPAHGALLAIPRPDLFADYQGKRVKAVMASRFGDIGVTETLDADRGYSARVMVSELSNFSDQQ